jgi:hypothetical protein
VWLWVLEVDQTKKNMSAKVAFVAVLELRSRKLPALIASGLAPILA